MGFLRVKTFVNEIFETLIGKNFIVLLLVVKIDEFLIMMFEIISRMKIPEFVVRRQQSSGEFSRVLQGLLKINRHFLFHSRIIRLILATLVTEFRTNYADQSFESVLLIEHQESAILSIVSHLITLFALLSILQGTVYLRVVLVSTSETLENIVTLRTLVVS